MTEQQAPVKESRFRRGVRTTHRTAYYLALLVAVATVVYLILLIAKNSKNVAVDYVFGTAHAPLVWLIVVSGLLGWFCGLATSYLLRRRFRRIR